MCLVGTQGTPWETGTDAVKKDDKDVFDFTVHGADKRSRTGRGQGVSGTLQLRNGGVFNGGVLVRVSEDMWLRQGSRWSDGCLWGSFVLDQWIGGWGSLGYHIEVLGRIGQGPSR